MDFFGKDQYKELIEVQQGPAVSIFIKANRQDNKGKNNQIAFRGQVDRAKKILEQRYPEDEFRPVEEMMDKWVNDGAFWGSLTKGAAAFFAPDVERVYRLDTDVDTETVVDETFHTRPMLGPMLAPQRYWVLQFDRNNTKLYEGGPDGIEEISLGDTPTNMADALQHTYPSHPMRNRESGAPNPQGVPSGVAGSNTAFHAQENERDLEPRHFREFSQIIDKAVCNLLENADGPVILAAVPKMTGVYREESNLDQLADEGLTESIVHQKPPQIHRKTWPLAKKAVETKLDEVLELWEREYGFGKGETDLNQIAKRTLMSQVRYLLIDHDRHIYGEFDRNEGNIEVLGEGREHADDGVDLLDELAEFVISRGGEVYVLSSERMPVDTGAAAILRGSGRAEYGGERARMT